jgi:glycine cleavage system H protein
VGLLAVIVSGFEFPDDLHYLVEHQTWARLEADGHATVGITAMGIRLAGEIYMCRPKSVGQLVEQGRSVAVVELAKAIMSVKSPLSGTVIEVNDALASRPELVHRDPYRQGWVARLSLTHWPAQSTALVHGDAVAAAMTHHAWLNQLTP